MNENVCLYVVRTEKDRERERKIEREKERKIDRKSRRERKR